MKEWSSAHVASLSYQMLVHRTQENTLLGLRNQSSRLGPILSPKARSLKGCFVPQVYWTQILLLTHPNYAGVWFSTWFVLLGYGFALVGTQGKHVPNGCFYSYFAMILNLDLKMRHIFGSTSVYGNFGAPMYGFSKFKSVIAIRLDRPSQSCSLLSLQWLPNFDHMVPSLSNKCFFYVHS